MTGVAIAATDGRNRRRQRNREAIVTALLELIGAGDLSPTANAIAARAGLQPRTVFRHFADLASLHAEAARRIRAEVLPIFLSVPMGGDFATRVRALVQARTTAFERVAPFKQAANRLRGSHQFIRNYQSATARELRRHLYAVLPELEAAPVEAAAAFELVTSLEAWERLRDQQGLPPAAARAAMEVAALALLPAMHAPG